ncbi:MAG: 3-keto-5-aminohexanoate cleavage protein [Thermomicrobiales bacterium]|nr:3-keto-5-aminohexanoate cleavage protein [Thermomicrobiales bacterium]
MPDPVIIEAALNGGRIRAEHPGVPLTAGALAAAARRCADAGASVVHVHARGRGGSWTASPAAYQRVVRAIRTAAPGVLVSITSLRPQAVAVERVRALLDAPPDALPDLISVNLGHITSWEVRRDAPEVTVASGGYRRETRHVPNSYADVARLLESCRTVGVTPELGLMDLGFISNAVALREDGLLPQAPWFLLELDSPAYGAGAQVAPATAANYAALAAALREQFPGAPWAAHGAGVATYGIVQRALADGAHVRVGFEDSVQMPDGTLARGDADQVAWAVRRAREVGRRPATPAEALMIISGKA